MFTRGRAAIAVAVIVAAMMTASAAFGHLTRSGGQWTYRYLTRAANQCGLATTGVDPLNVVFIPYGTGAYINDHANEHTHWGFYDPNVPRGDQYICGDSDSQPGNYTVNVRNFFDDQEGHGSWHNAMRAHFRIWNSPHGHIYAQDMWSTIAVHHEQVETSTNIHTIDEPWETWETHFWSEMWGHTQYPDYYVRQGGQNIQGFYDNGMITRVDGRHPNT
jgi:hypothetical protein